MKKQVAAKMRKFLKSLPNSEANQEEINRAMKTKKLPMKLKDLAKFKK